VATLAAEAVARLPGADAGDESEGGDVSAGNGNGAAPGLSLGVPPELVEAIAQRAAEIVLEQQGAAAEPPGYLDVDGAAAFLACPTSRIYRLVSAKRIPHHRDGSRLLFDRGELRDYVRRGGATTP
jgi:excisionase family DNA binding protein